MSTSDIKNIYEAALVASQIEVIPRYLMPVEYQDQGWCIIENVLGIVDKTLIKIYVDLCRSNRDVESAQTSFISMIATGDNHRAITSRKRMCLSGAIAAKDEFRLNTLILQSHLRKHNKSPALWHHRRWLLTTFEVQTCTEREFKVVEQAAMYHPMNYYAWGYMRWWYDWAQVHKNSEEDQLLAGLVRDLCSKNLGDVSMWTFLHWLHRDDLEQFAARINDEFPGHDAILAAITTRT